MDHIQVNVTKFELPQNDIGVSSGRVGRAFALHELAEGYYFLLAMIRFVQNGPTNHANLKAPPNPHSESTAPGIECYPQVLTIRNIWTPRNQYFFKLY